MRLAEARSPATPALARPLRIVHVGGASGRNATNGVGRAVYALSEAQRALGHDAGLVNERAEHFDDHHSEHARRSPFAAAREHLRRRTRQVSQALVDELLDFRPDIVHLHSIHVPENVLLSRHVRRANVPYCVTVHGGLCRAAQQGSRIRKTALWWLGEREYLDHAIFVHALTREEALDIEAYGVKAPIVVAPNGIDAPALPRAKDPSALFAVAPQLAGHRVFLFMGRFAWLQKGLDLLLHGLSLANVPDSRLVLLGPDWKDGHAHLEHLVDRLGLRSQVVFLGQQAAQRCADLVAGADVFVHTSRWEGMSLSVLEAAVWEKPCLLTRAADPNDALGQSGGALVVEPTPESIADGLRALSTRNRTTLAMMGHQARATVVNRFTWNHTATTLIEAIDMNRRLDAR